MLSRWRHRLDRLLTWKRATSYALLLISLYVFAWEEVLRLGSPPLNSSGAPIGGDYIAFHAAGRLVLAGHANLLYDHAAVSAVQGELLGGRNPDFYDAYRNPPFFALLFVPLAFVDLLTGFAIYSLLSLGGLCLAIWLLLREAPWLRSHWRGLVILVLAFPPVYFGLINGENALLSLLLYVLIYRGMSPAAQRAASTSTGAATKAGSWTAGVWAALGLFKPQLFFVFPLVLLIGRRWRALGAYVVVAVALAGVSLAMVGGDGLQAWGRILLEPESGNAAANAWRMFSLKTFFDLLLPGTQVLSFGLYVAAAVVLLALLVGVWSRARPSLPLAWVFTTLVAVLVNPHLVDYDLSVLVSGAVATALVARLRWWLVLLYLMLLLRLQLPIGDLSVQLAVPVLLWCAYVARREALASCAAPAS